MFAGSALAAFLGVVVAVWLWWFIWHSKGGFARKPYRDLPGIGNVLRWQRESAYFSDRADSQPNISTLSILTDSSEAATNTNKTVNSLIASSTYARTEPAAVHSMSDKCLLASTAKPQRSSEGTVFFTSRPVMTEVSHVHWPTSQQIFQPKPQTLFIPAPLWQDVEIASENICIAQTSAGTDWILGQGSYGMVCSSSCSCSCLIMWLIPKHSVNRIEECRCTLKSELNCMIAALFLCLQCFSILYAHVSCACYHHLIACTCSGS